MEALNSTLGSYMPAFFRMDVDFTFPSGADWNHRLSEKDVSVFTHEYIHFLQDISTYVGLNNAYVYSEQIHGMVNYVYKHPYGPIKIPINLPYNFGNIDLNKFVNINCFGDFEEQEEFFLKKIKIKELKVDYQNDYVRKLQQIYLIPTRGKKVVFGARAIMESMAYIIETLITRGFTTPPDFPYLSAEKVINYYYPEFGKDKLRIIALCDCSLQFSQPGKIFVQTLKVFREEKRLPTPYEVIDHFYLSPCEQMGQMRNLIYGLIYQGFSVGKRLELYMQGSSFKPFHNVIHKLIGFGLKERLENKYFMLDIVQNGYVLDNPLMQRYIKEIGTPIIKDSNSDYWEVLPIGFNQNNYWIEYFPAIEQVYNCLAEGQDICDLIPWCEKSPQTVQDDRCYCEPWTRCNDIRLCPYAMLWRHWNLSNYIPYA